MEIGFLMRTVMIVKAKDAQPPRAVLMVRQNLRRAPSLSATAY